MRCGHPAYSLAPLFPARDYVTGDRFEVARCASCGLALTTPPPAPSALARYYPVAYYGSPGRRRFPLPVERGQQLLHDARARWVERLRGRGPGRVLDVGCGRGLLLSAFRRRGWQVEGTELSDAACHHAREQAGLTVHVGPVEALGLPAGRYDAVTLWHVLEHVPEPGAVLAEARRLLAPGGVLLVSVPNFASLEARLAGPGWFHLDVPRHLVHFTPATLRAALAAEGFEEIDHSWLAPEYDAFSFVQSLLNRAGLPQNLLYDLLRRRGARFSGGRATPLQVAATALLGAPLAVVSPLATALASLVGQGTTFTLLARRVPETHPAPAC